MVARLIWILSALLCAKTDPYKKSFLCQLLKKDRPCFSKSICLYERIYYNESNILSKNLKNHNFDHWDPWNSSLEAIVSKLRLDLHNYTLNMGPFTYYVSHRGGFANFWFFLTRGEGELADFWFFSDKSKQICDIVKILTVFLWKCHIFTQLFVLYVLFLSFLYFTHV